MREEKSEREARALALRPMSPTMRRFSTAIFFLLGVGLTAFALINPLGLPFLPGEDDGEATTVTANAEAPPPVQLYQCPMHPEVIESEPGDCPICHMKLMPMDSAEPSPAAEPVQLYQCPMHPEVIESEPGDCPICHMKLMPMDSAEPSRGAEAKEAAGVVRIDPVQVQNIGVVSRRARTEDIARTVRTVGILDFNADRITWVNTKFSGWIEKVHVSYVGQEVRRGQPLFEIYSPELVTTQEEYLRALNYKQSLEASTRTESRRQAESLLRAARERLLYWDIAEDQIETLTQRREVQRRLTVRAPVDGVIAEVMDESLEGRFVKAGMNLYRIADLTSLWAHADVHESDIPWVRENQPVEVSFRSDPQRVLRGKILFLYPEVSRETRTLKICVEVPNRNKRLRAGMYADVVVHGPPIRDALVVPDSAVLRSGERDLVFVDLGEGRFEPRKVTLGIRGEQNVIQVTSGLVDGEAVVTQAQFMLDSESRVQEAIAKFLARGAVGPAHRHGDSR